MPTIEYTCECGNCNGTGIYCGIDEGKGAGVVCRTCKGTGRRDVVIKYREFEGRKRRDNVRHVYETNPGIGVGEGNGYTFSDFGGMSYDDWLAGKPFGPGTENRHSTCPAWWFQSAPGNRKPEWPECIVGGQFLRCKHFPQKAQCWTRWDNEPEE